jgi:hypothetical protein
MKGFLSYVLVLVGTGMVALACAQAMQVMANYAQGRLLLVNLLRTNPARAEATCRQSRGTFYEAVGAAMAGAAQTQARDPKVLEMAIGPSFEAVATTVGIKQKMMLGKLKMAALPLGGGIVLAYSNDNALYFHILCALIAIGGAAWLFMYTQESASAFLRAKGEILPEVMKAFVEGRYIPGQK